MEIANRAPPPPPPPAPATARPGADAAAAPGATPAATPSATPDASPAAAPARADVNPAEQSAARAQNVVADQAARARLERNFVGASPDAAAAVRAADPAAIPAADPAGAAAPGAARAGITSDAAAETRQAERMEQGLTRAVANTVADFAQTTRNMNWTDAFLAGDVKPTGEFAQSARNLDDAVSALVGGGSATLGALEGAANRFATNTVRATAAEQFETRMRTVAERFQERGALPEGTNIDEFVQTAVNAAQGAMAIDPLLEQNSASDVGAAVSRALAERYGWTARGLD